jgi:hypothetical protein
MWYARFLLVLGLVQLVDTILWVYEDELLIHYDVQQHEQQGMITSHHKPQQQCGPVNRFMSSYILPMVLTYGALEQIHCGLNHRKFKLGKFLTSMKIIGIVSAPFRFEMYWDSSLPRCTSIMTYTNHHILMIENMKTLVWADVSTISGKPLQWVIVGTIVFSLSFLLMKPIHFGIRYASIGLISSIVVYVINPIAWGSNWCAIAVIFSLLFLIDIITFKPTLTDIEQENIVKTTNLKVSNLLFQRQLSASKQRRKAVNAALNGKLTIVKEFENYPLLNELRHRTGWKEFHVACFIVGLFLLSLLSERSIRTFSNLVGFSFPAWASIDALESSNKRDDTQWLTYWLLFGSFSILEISLLGYLQSILPFYFAFKIGFLVWAQAPNARGAQFVYSRILAPLMKDHSMIPARQS